MNQTTLQSGFTVGLLVDHAKAIRIPLLIILFGIVVTFWVDQVHELFLLLVLPTCTGIERTGAFLMAACLGGAVWHTSRTVYRFRIPTIPTLCAPAAAGLRTWAPRVLGAAVPMLMALGTGTALHDPTKRDPAVDISWLIPAAFVAEGIVLFVFFVSRRALLRNLRAFRHMCAKPIQDPRVERWGELPVSVRAIYLSIVLANVLAVILAARSPGLLSHLGVLGLILICGTFLTITGTWLTIQAACRQFPMLSFLFIIAVGLQIVGSNDNHRVRLDPQMHSDGSLNKALDRSAPLSTSFVTYANGWASRSPPVAPVYLVSAEGGGIRAAVWTALVLGQLEVNSHGEFSKHMLLGSGVSGGSLGLAWFAALVKGERLGVIQPTDIDAIVKQVALSDYLGPTLETMFLTDFLQRFVPWRAFVDRGERLERQWEGVWTAACLHRNSARAVPPTATEIEVCTSFSRPWKDLWGTAGVPALFLNSTEVASGYRFIQEPFATMRASGGDAGVTNAATLSTGYLPATVPLSSVVLNSARFTYVSPAGSLLDITDLNSGKARQLVDGGYFENSGTTTITEIMALLRQVYPMCSQRKNQNEPADSQGGVGFGTVSCPIKLIHISNDPAVGPMRSDDSCPGSTGSSDSQFGEIRAPIIALVNTRDARGAAARAAVRRLFAHGEVPKSETDALTNDYVYHFRLCKGERHLPLGWTLSQDSLDEMNYQLSSPKDTNIPGVNLEESKDIVAAVSAGTR